MVDGVAYVRTCQVAARPGMVVERHPVTGNPPLPVDEPVAEIPVERRHAELVVIGGGASGRAAAASHDDALVLDAGAGQEVVAIYPGPTVIVRTPAGMLHVEADEIVVATGAAEIQPVCPGNDLAGILTSRAAERLRAAGVELDAPAVTVGEDLVRFEGDDAGHVRAVVTRDVGRRRGRATREDRDRRSRPGAA